jgi:choline dehydrogenase-like flavoprotein
MTENDSDVLIVGSGAAGSAIAWRLSELGFSITCLEQGPAVSSSDFPSNYQDWESRKLHEFNPDPNIRKNKHDYEINNNGSPIEIANFNAVGGSTVIFSGHFPRFHPSDFKSKTLSGVGDDWPIDYLDLKPYYELNENILGVSGLSGDPKYPDIKNLAPPIPMGRIGEKIGAAFNQLGWHWWPSYSAIVTRKFGDRNVCINLGPCNTGCSQGAKSSADVSYWPLAIKAGVKLQTETRVSKLLIDDSESVCGVESFDKTGSKIMYRAKIVVLAASGVGTPRILLNSANAQNPRGLANSSGLVGKRLMLHPLAYIEGEFAENLDSNWGPQGCSILSQEFYSDSEQNTFRKGYTFQLLRGSGPVEWMQSRLRRKEIEWGVKHQKYFEDNFNRTISLAAIIEDLPESTNYIDLDPIKRDFYGIPIPRINYALSQNSKLMLAHALKKGKLAMEVAGANKILAFGPVKNTGWHIMGTARMGDDPENSVVDRDCKAHDLKNLYIVDSSIFVTSAGVNPANTIQALALRAGDAIAKRLGAHKNKKMGADFV